MDNEKIVPRKSMTFYLLAQLAGMAFISGAVLSQLIDFAYPISNALHYHKMFWKFGRIEICWFIVMLYGVAGIILWTGTVLLDRKFGQEPVVGFDPPWGTAITGALYFVAQFYLAPYFSGILALPNVLILVFTMSTTMLGWWFLDRTRTGVCMMVVAGTLGPLSEVFMINVLDVYHYTRPDVFGVPLWFVGAYACGCAPWGNLGRKYITYLERG